MSSFWTSIGFGLVTAGYLSMAAVGLTMQFGVSNYVNLGYGQYMTLGAFFTWDVVHFLGVSLWLAGVIGSVGVGVVSVLIGKYVLNPFVRRGTPGTHMLLVTFSLALALDAVIGAVWGTDSREFGVTVQHPHHIGPLLLTTQELELIALSIALLIGTHLLLTRTRLGKAMRAMSDNKTLAQLSGIPIKHVTDVVLVYSGILAGVGGVFLAIDVSAFDMHLGMNFFFVVLAAVVVGGIGRPYGTMAGALIIGLAIEVSTNVIPAVYKLDVAFAILILILLFRPQGLARVAGKV